jgi:hypothetical protein
MADTVAVKARLRKEAAPADCLAEGEGFEPPLPFRVKRFSRPPVSTAHTSLRESVISSLPAPTVSPDRRLLVHPQRVASHIKNQLFTGILERLLHDFVGTFVGMLFFDGKKQLQTSSCVLGPR